LTAQRVAPSGRVLVLTMHDDPAYLRAALVAGASGYIVKKAADVELLTAIRAVHQGRTFVDLTRPGEPARSHEVRRVSRGSPAAGQPRPLSRREGEVLRLLAQGHTNQEAADQLAVDGIEAEVIDLRSLRPLDVPTILSSVAKTHRAVIVDEGWRMCSFAAEVSAQIMEGAFFELDAPVGRVCSAEVPMPYAKHMEDAALPQAPVIVQAALEVLHRHG